MRERVHRYPKLVPGCTVTDHDGEPLGTVEAIVPSSDADDTFIVLSLDSRLSNSTTLFAIPIGSVAFADEGRTGNLNLGIHTLRQLFGFGENSTLHTFLSSL